MIITIDGPAGSGKSTVAQRIAQQLNIFYLNTGLLYRTVAYLLFVDPTAPFFNQLDKGIESLTLAHLQGLPALEYSYLLNGAAVSVAGKDITAQLFATTGIDQLASKISALPAVREYLLELQRVVATKHDVIADGRDCGTVVFPDAEYKFFLTASVEVRAQRRMLDPKTQALGLTYDQVRADVAERDERDKNRAIAPLRIPDQAVIIDASSLSIDEVVKKIITSIRM